MSLSILTYSSIFVLFLLSTYKISNTVSIDRCCNRIFHGFSLFVCILILGLRYNVGTDYLSYERLFYQTDKRTLEVFYQTLSDIFFKLNLPYWCMTVVIETIKILLSQRLICKVFPRINKKLFWFFFFTTSFLFQSLNIQRHALATLCFLQGMNGIKNRNFFIYLFWILIGAGFHYSILLMIFLYPICLFYLSFPQGKLIIMYVLFVISFIFNEVVSKLLLDLLFFLMQFTPYAHYGSLLFSWDLPSERGIGKVVRFVVFSIAFLFRKKLNREYRQDFDVIFFLSFIGNTLSNMFSYSMLLFRLFFPFITCNIILYSFLFDLLRHYKKYIPQLLYYGGLALFVLYCIGQILSSNNNCSPYQFVFER